MPKPAFSRPVYQRKGPKTEVSVQQSKRKRAKTKGKGKISQHRLEEDEWTAEESEDDVNVNPREPRPVRKQRRVVTDIYQGDNFDDADVFQDIAMRSPPPETGEGSSGGPGT